MAGPEFERKNTGFKNTYFYVFFALQKKMTQQYENDHNKYIFLLSKRQ
jgi:hypothetical protein